MVLCGENPCAFFYSPKTKKLRAAISYWTVTYSEFGCGGVLFLGEPEDRTTPERLRCLTDNMKLASQIHSNFNRHFEIFKDFAGAPAYSFASVSHSFDGKTLYEVSASYDLQSVHVSWSGLRRPQQTNVKIDGFGADSSTKYDVSATIIACSAASLAINGRDSHLVISGRYGAFDSSAFLSLAESWGSEFV